MYLSDLSEIFIGQTGWKYIFKLFFPNIPPKNLSIIQIDSNNINGSNTYSSIVKLNFSNKLASNSIISSLVKSLSKYINFDSKTNTKEVNLIELMDLISLYENQIEKIETYARNSNDEVKEIFIKALRKIDESRIVTQEKYIQNIYTYIINKRYDIALFLITCVVMLSPTIDNLENINNRGENWSNLLKSIALLDDFQHYEKYLNTEKYSYEKYIPPIARPLDISIKETSTEFVKLIPNNSMLESSLISNTRNPKSRNFYGDILDDYTCTELHIMSVFASNWSLGVLYEKLINRLKGNFKVKLLVLNVNASFSYVYNDIQDYLNYNLFPVFEKLSEQYPNKFQIRYVNIPITNRIVEDVSNKRMRVDFITVPNVTDNNLVKFLSEDNLDEKFYYRHYSQQFNEIWEKYSLDTIYKYDYNTFDFGNVTDSKFYNFYSYCIDNSNKIGMVSPTASSWIGTLFQSLYNRLQEDDFSIEFIILNTKSKNFANTIGNIDYIINTQKLDNLKDFKKLIEMYPNKVSVYITDYFISNTITIDFTNEIMRVDNHIWNSKKPHTIRGCLKSFDENRNKRKN